MDLADRLAASMRKKNFSQYRLAEVSKVPQPTIQRILSRDTLNPKADTVRPLALALGESLDYLMNGIHPSVPTGNHDSPVGQMVPVINWTTVPVVVSDKDSSPATMAESWRPCPVMHGPRTFMFRVQDDSMASLIPNTKTYPIDCLVVVDPDAPAPQSGKPILAKLRDGSVVFRLLMLGGGSSWLLAINKDYNPTDPITEFDIAGTVLLKMEEP